MIVGFVAVNAYFIISIVFAKNLNEKNSKYQTLRFLAMGSWIAIVVWFMITVLIFYIKNSGRPFKTDNHKLHLRYIGIIFIVWSIAFIVKAILSILVLNSSF
jgi:hypothetical protein